MTNQATGGGSGVDENGDELLDASGQALIASDVSDNGSATNDENGEASTDGTFGNDATPIYIADLGIANSIVGEPEFVDGQFLVTFQLVIENTGTVDLANLSLTEDLASQFGVAYINATNLTLSGLPGNPQSNIAVNPDFNGGSNTELLDVSQNNILQTGDSFVLTFVAEVNPGDEDLNNQVTGSGDAIDENGHAIFNAAGQQVTAFDFSDSGTNPNTSNFGVLGDSGQFSDPTIFRAPNQGTTGNPPRLPFLSPINTGGLSSLLSNFIGGPGPIYSGSPISSTGNPLSLDSNRPVTGGYSISQAAGEGSIVEIP